MFLGFSGGSDGKESASNVGDLDSIPGLGRSPGLKGETVPDSLPATPKSPPLMAPGKSGLHVDRRAWQATVHGVAESQT